MSSTETIELQIRNVVQGGRGLARHAGKVIFVAGALPGERVLAQIVRHHERYDEAVTIERLESNYRQAYCHVAEVCGGCDWMRMSESRQLALKTELIRAETVRLFGDQSEGFWQPPLPSPQFQGYRCRITVKVVPGQVGYYAQGTHHLVPIDDCPIAAQPIREVLPRLATDAVRLASVGIREVELRAGPTDKHPLGVVRGPGAQRRLLQSVYLRGIAGDGWREGDSDLRYVAASCAFVAGPGTFVQVNLGANAQLVATVVRLAESAETIADLFCGNGNFSIPLAKAGHKVIGLEGNTDAFADAERNAANNQVEARWYSVPEVRMAATLDRAGFPREGAILLDPPRAGARRVLEDIFGAGRKPAMILYVSCEPATLLRDLRFLKEQGYVPDFLQTIDMFPQTHHVETLVRLRCG